MPRVANGTRRHERRKKILQQAKGYWGRRSKLFRTAKDAVAKAQSYAYRDRRQKKRDFRALWITRISAACKTHDISYSRLIDGLKKSNVELNRKALSNMAIEDPAAFAAVVETAKKGLGASV